jgi:putative colanic acid biosynthesis acetyltransferase WcaF
MHLDGYDLGDYTPGAPLWKQVLWYCIGSALLGSRLSPSSFNCLLLRLFGAQIGKGVRIKPGVRVKFPWRLSIGDYVWLGENCWVDNVAPVTIESHVCISQEAFLCTGNHSWSDPNFQLTAASIHLQTGCWIAARAIVGPGVTAGQGAVLSLGSVAGQSLEPMTIYAGNPAQPIKARRIELDHDLE